MPKGVYSDPAGRARKIAAAHRRGRFFDCEVCGKKFWRKPRDIKKGDCRFCSRDCYFTWQRGQPKRMTAKGRKRFLETHSGEHNANWKGGITPHNKRLRSSEEYRKWRDGIFRRDNWTCQECGARCGNGANVRLAAHHVKPFATFPDLRFRVDNGTTLCLKCHNKQPKGKQIYNITA